MTFKTYLFICALSSLLILSTEVRSQQTIPFTSDQWTFTGAHSLETYQGKKGVRLYNSRAYLPNVSFKNGIVEYDVFLSTQRGFGGVHFRVQDGTNYEEYYMRSHQSGNPDAMQYSPVFNGLVSWQLYHGNGYSQAFTYSFTRWMHVKLVIVDDEMEVYIDNMEEPVLYAFDLKREPESGYLGVYTFLNDIHFANFTFQSMDNPPLKRKKKPEIKTESGTIISWEVSSTFLFADLDSEVTLPASLTEISSWQTLPTEPTGTINLAPLNGVSKEKNAVFVKVTVNSDKAQIKPLHFGYSDAVKVYVNGKAIYGGSNRFRSRDYRYLGTIGYFDTVYVPLEKGENEIRFAVSESEGGWGIKAKWEDLAGISL